MQTNYEKNLQTGGTRSKKSDSIIILESELQKDFLEILEFDHNVWYFKVNPVEINYSLKKEKYVPDFLIYYRKDLYPSKKFKPMLCEIIKREELWKNWKEIKPKLQAAVKFASQEGFRFKIVTENEIYTPFLQNIKFLSRYKNSNVLIDDIQLLINKLKIVNFTSPEELIMLASKDRYKQAELLYTLWYLISEGVIICDLTLKLNMKSEIW